MPARLEVLFSPAEFSALAPGNVAGAVCVVFDVLRATTTMLAALGQGAAKIYPVKEIAGAVDLKRSHPDAILAGERDGVRILAGLTGGPDFDLGNSPREFTAERVAGRDIIMTTTNGTRALHACRGAQHILAGAILNLDALAHWIRASRPARVLVICAGTYEEAAYEDTWAAGALCDRLWPLFALDTIADSAQIARQIFLAAPSDFSAAWQLSRNARRLLSQPALRDDVAFSWRPDVSTVLAEMRGDTVLRMK